MKLLATKRNSETVASRFSDLENEINRFFERGWSPVTQGAPSGWYPVLDVMDEGESLRVVVEVPGMNKKDIRITSEAETLTISGERKSDQKDSGGEFYHRERTYGKFSRSMKFPVPVDSSKAKAAYVDGVLSVELPKVEEKQPKSIKVEVK